MLLGQALGPSSPSQPTVSISANTLRPSAGAWQLLQVLPRANSTSHRSKQDYGLATDELLAPQVARLTPPRYRNTTDVRDMRCRERVEHERTRRDVPIPFRLLGALLPERMSKSWNWSIL